MREPGRRIGLLIALGLCALGVVSAIALGAPAKPAAHHSSARRPRYCARKADRRRLSAHQRAVCRRFEHHSTPKAAAPVAGGSTDLGSSPAPGAATTTTGATPPPASSPEGEGSGSSAPPTVPHVEVTAVEYHFTLSRSTVPAGRVIFEFVNQGEDEHNLNVADEEGAEAGSFANTPSKGIRHEEIILRPGTYTLFCSLPEHEKKGMKATLTVE